MNSAASKLFRAHSTKYLRGEAGVIHNPNLQRVRRPRDVPPAIHQLVGEWFVEKFGIDYRGRSLFCSGDASVAAGYTSATSTLISLEPVDDFCVCFSPSCKDLFGHYQFHWSSDKTRHEKIREDLDSLGFVHRRNEGLSQAAASGNEVMLFAERFRYRVVRIETARA